MHPKRKFLTLYALYLLRSGGHFFVAAQGKGAGSHFCAFRFPTAVSGGTVALALCFCVMENKKREGSLGSLKTDVRRPWGLARRVSGPASGNRMIRRNRGRRPLGGGAGAAAGAAPGSRSRVSGERGERGSDRAAVTRGGGRAGSGRGPGGVPRGSRGARSGAARRSSPRSAGGARWRRRWRAAG